MLRLPDTLLWLPDTLLSAGRACRVATHPPFGQPGCETPSFRPAVRAGNQIRTYLLPECAQ